MPYFIFKITARGRLEPLTHYVDYRSAKRDVTQRRRQIEPHDDYTIRMVHAPDTAAAERLLSEKREPRPLGEDG